MSLESRLLSSLMTSTLPDGLESSHTKVEEVPDLSDLTFDDIDRTNYLHRESESPGSQQTTTWESLLSSGWPLGLAGVMCCISVLLVVGVVLVLYRRRQNVSSVTTVYKTGHPAHYFRCQCLGNNIRSSTLDITHSIPTDKPEIIKKHQEQPP